MDTEDEEYILSNPNTFSSEINILEKISMWTIMSLCHDLGYPLEKSKNVLAKTEKMMEAFVSNPHIERNLKFDGTRDSNNIEIITFASKKMKFISKKKSKKAKYKASIQDKYKFKYKLSLEDFSHGSGSCRLCKPCYCKMGKPCKHPDRMRYSMEATGLNVQRLSLDFLEHELLWYKDKTLPRYTSAVTLVLYNEDFTIENMVRLLEESMKR